MTAKFIRFFAALATICSIAGNTRAAQAERPSIPGVSAVDLTPLASSLGIQFLHYAFTANTTSHYTILDHPLANGHPDAIILVTPNRIYLPAVMHLP
jgi:hypothetical protein